MKFHPSVVDTGNWNILKSFQKSTEGHQLYSISFLFLKLLTNTTKTLPFLQKFYLFVKKIFSCRGPTFNVNIRPGRFFIEKMTVCDRGVLRELSVLITQSCRASEGTGLLARQSCPSYLPSLYHVNI